jgi:hypothetical protein
LHVLNELLSSGGGDGGMSPGASWTPFEISGSDYAALIPRVLNPERSRLAALARYHDQEWSLDPELDHHTDYVAWRQAACEKHRSAYDAKRKRR